MGCGLIGQQMRDGEGTVANSMDGRDENRSIGPALDMDHRTLHRQRLERRQGLYDRIGSVSRRHPKHPP
jgi:hypothetical protein